MQKLGNHISFKQSLLESQMWTTLKAGETERRKKTPKFKKMEWRNAEKTQISRRNRGTAEKPPQNRKRRNDGNSPEILKERSPSFRGKTPENQPK